MFRNTYHWRCLFLSALTLCAAGANAADMTAEEVMIRVDKRYEGDTRKQLGRLTLIDKSNNRRVRNVMQLAKQYGEDEKTITQVLSPAEVSGTTILSYDWDAAASDDETWLYLPQLRKVKRLATTDKSAYFLGSDFSYVDLTGIDVEDFAYRFADGEGSDTQWVILARPREDIERHVIDETGYIKAKYWVDKEKNMIVKAQYWLDEGSKIKYYSVDDIEMQDDIWAFKKAQMVLTQGNNMLHASIFEVDSVEYNLPVDDETFTTYAMERSIE